MRHAALGLILIVLSVVGLMTQRGAAPAEWRDGSTHGRWEVVFTGHGTVTGDDEHVVLAPKVAASHDLTHGALVVDRSAPADIELDVTMRTDEQLREGGKPNPWEVGWVLWRYTDPDHFYAVALKPNGWELSKQDPAYPGKQRFLASGASPTFSVGRPHSVRVTHVGNTITVASGGRELVRFTDTERPYPAGGLALYTEDARVTFSDIAMRPAP